MAGSGAPARSACPAVQAQRAGPAAEHAATLPGSAPGRAPPTRGRRARQAARRGRCRRLCFQVFGRSRPTPGQTASPRLQQTAHANPTERRDRGHSPCRQPPCPPPAERGREGTGQMEGPIVPGGAWSAHRLAACAENAPARWPPLLRGSGAGKLSPCPVLAWTEGKGPVGCPCYRNQMTAYNSAFLHQK